MPSAQIAHSSSCRLRLKVIGRRGDAAYFADVSKRLESAFHPCSVKSSALTGSVLIYADSLDIQAVTDFGQKEALFRVEPAASVSQPLSRSIVSPLQTVNRNVMAATDGRMDLPGALFIMLLLFGIIELIRGNWRSPPWYTALWYAFGLYSKTLFDQAAAMEAIDPGDE